LVGREWSLHAVSMSMGIYGDNTDGSWDWSAGVGMGIGYQWGGTGNKF